MRQILTSRVQRYKAIWIEANRMIAQLLLITRKHTQVEHPTDLTAAFTITVNIYAMKEAHGG